MPHAHKDMAKMIRSLAYRHATHHVFSDFIEMSAISLSNAVDLRQRDEREARYMQIVGRYEKDELQHFPKLLAMLIEGLEEEPCDILGALFHELELHNEYKGQFFTPYHLSKMMAMMTFDEGANDIIKERGFIRASEPACGSGGMVIALAEAMKYQGINYQKHLHVIATDLDIRCVHMAYVQCSLLHIPAVIVHGNTLSLEEFGHWYTPAHIMGFWDGKLKHLENAEAVCVEAGLEPVAIEEQATITKPTKHQQLTLF